MSESVGKCRKVSESVGSVGSPSGLICERRALEGAVREDADWEVTIEGTVCVKGMMWKRIFNLRSTYDVDMNILYV